MKIHLFKLILLGALVAPLAFASRPPHAATSRDPAAERLAAHGRLAISAAGPYVERGTFRVQVAAKLGRPDAVLADGTWLYERHAIAGSAAQGTLVVRFADGRVTDLALLMPGSAAALRTEIETRGESSLLAAARHLR